MQEQRGCLVDAGWEEREGTFRDIFADPTQGHPEGERSLREQEVAGRPCRIRLAIRRFGQESL